MKKMWGFIVGCVFCMLFVASCSSLTTSKPDDGKDTFNAYEKENYIPVQSYTGEGFTLRQANSKTGDIAKENREEIVAAVEGFFQSNYKTEVKVHNIVSAIDGVSVFVESVGEPHFYTFAIVPIDVKSKQVKTDNVWSQEGQVENAIQSGLYAMAFEDAFEHLDQALEDVTQELPVIGLPIEAVENVKGTGFSTPHYFVSPNGDIFDELYDRYLQDPEISKEEVTQFFKENPFETEEMIITINLYMEESAGDPTDEILESVVAEIEELDHAPRGSYSILIHDQWIDKRRANGMKENTKKRTTPDKIIKE